MLDVKAYDGYRFAPKSLSISVDKKANIKANLKWRPCLLGKAMTYSTDSSFTVCPPYSGRRILSPCLTATGINSPLCRFRRPGPTATTSASWICGQVYEVSISTRIVSRYMLFLFILHMHASTRALVEGNESQMGRRHNFWHHHFASLRSQLSNLIATEWLWCPRCSRTCFVPLECLHTILSCFCNVIL